MLFLQKYLQMKNITSLFKAVLIVALISFNSGYGQKAPGQKVILFGKEVKASNINPDNGIIRCATVEYEKFLQESDPKRMTDAQFEAWINPLVAAYKAGNSTASQAGGIITIPVVVHVIHNGQAVGTAPNITDSQVQSQITVMNNDFRRMAGTPGFNTSAIGTDTQVQFALAQQDPNGNPTNGINRVNLCQPSWSTGDINGTVKPTTQWDPNLYLNMWSVNFSDQTLLGYAQFPNATGLPGLSFSGGSANTDGVVCNYATFGSINYNDGTFLLNAPYNEGRTMTHEVGHWIGLRHIWGDGGCAVDDFCADTPNAGQANFGCPTIDSCPEAGIDMVQNYMDYSDDACMNIFTVDQKARMTVIMNGAPRRVTLKTSTKDQPMTLFANDAEIKIDASCSSAAGSCDVVPSKKVTIYNRGTAVLTSASLTYTVNGGAPITYAWTGSLATHKFATFNMPITATGNGPLVITIVNANGTPDQRATNNTATGTYTAPVAPANYTMNNVVFRLQKDQYGTETTWNLKNGAGAILYSGGPYTNVAGGGPIITQNWTLANNQCYVFTINDAYGDGICCAYGNGFYDIKSTDGVTTLASGATFGATESKFFTINLLANDKFAMEGSIQVYPNPSKGILNIGVAADLGLPTSYTIMNALGQVVSKKAITSDSDLSIDTSNYSSGLYFIRVDKDLNSTTSRFIKE